MTVTRGEFETAIDPLLRMIQVVVFDCIKQWTLLPSADAELDEIVLVGGCSRIPSVRAAIRRACRDSRQTKFCRLKADLTDGGAILTDMGDKKDRNNTTLMGEEQFAFELCCGVNPETVVAEGLAIRGAVLSGVKSSKLQNLLMMDCLAMSIGVLCWSSDSTGKDDDRFFDAVLNKGNKIPAKGVKRFQLSKECKRFVSLDIYEEIEECVVVTSADIEKTTLEGNESDVPISLVEYNHEYSYNIIATVDVPLPLYLLDKRRSGIDQGNSIDIEFSICEDGMLSYKAIPVLEFDSTQSEEIERDLEDKASADSLMKLFCFLALFTVAFFLVKLFLSGSPVKGDRLINQ
jgi:molecular chaperone DnaK (HSP70)